MTTATLLPDPAGVATHWLKGLAALEQVDINETLPDVERWSSDTFVTTQTVGGPADEYTGLRTPVVQVDVWVRSISSTKLQWAKAANVMEQILAATYDPASSGLVTISSKYFGARVESVSPTSEPMRVWPQGESMARYTCDFQFCYLVNSS
jgi:hypothetical protein